MYVSKCTHALLPVQRLCRIKGNDDKREKGMMIGKFCYKSFDINVTKSFIGTVVSKSYLSFANDLGLQFNDCI